MQDKQFPPFNNQSDIRQYCLNIRNNLSTEQHRAASQSACEQITASNTYLQAQHIAAYLSVGKEVDLQQLIQQALQDGKYIYLPRIVGQEIVFTHYTEQSSLVKNRFGILEPSAASSSIEISLLDVIYLPLVAFDKQGQRIGMGGGYYDRYLYSVKDKTRPIRVGVAHPEQEVNDCLPQAWDVALHTVTKAR